MKLENVENQRLHTLCYDTITDCDLDVRKELCDNIILSGGTTLIPGLAERLQSEVQSLAPINARVRVAAPDDRYLAVWMGGSILASLSTFDQNWIYASSYETDGGEHRMGYAEYGPRIVHMMCNM